MPLCTNEGDAKSVNTTIKSNQDYVDESTDHQVVTFLIVFLLRSLRSVVPKVSPGAKLKKTQKSSFLHIKHIKNTTNLEFKMHKRCISRIIKVHKCNIYAC